MFYLLDKETYIELFCENREKPELHCDGKCSLNKNAAENSDHKSEIPERITMMSFPDFISNEEFDFQIISFSEFTTTTFGETFSLYNFQYLKNLNQPPEGLMI